jgi:hypothetical protein
MMTSWFGGEAKKQSKPAIKQANPRRRQQWRWFPPPISARSSNLKLCCLLCWAFLRFCQA